MFNDPTTPLSLLATRRSGKPRDLVAPGPDEAQLRRILSAGMRVPDHGKLAPWRFVVIEPERRPVFADLIEEAYLADRPQAGPEERESSRQFALQAPTLVVVLSTPRHDSKVPVWEQELSAGAACMNILTAAHAMGFLGGWLTGWASYSEMVLRALGGSETDRIAGFLFLGTSGRAQEERPRPVYDEIVSTW